MAGVHDMDHDIGPVSSPFMDPETGDLYRLYSAGGHLLYVGISFSTAITRIRHHSKHQPWWDQVAITTVEKVPRDGLREAERRAIVEEKPRFNKMHNGDRPYKRAAKPGRPPKHRPNLVSWEQAATLLPIDPGELGFLVSTGHIRKVEILGAEFLRGDDIAKIIDEGLPGEAFGLNRLTA